jgi:hypothetical protein
VPVACRRLDGELALLEFNNGAGVVAVADVDECHALGFLVRTGGQVELGDAVAERDGCGVVHKPQQLQAGNVGGVLNTPSLRVRVPGWAAEHNVLHGQLELGGGGLLDLCEEHGHELGAGELLLLAEVVDLDADLAIDLDERGRDVLLLNLNIRVLEGSAR